MSEDWQEGDSMNPSAVAAQQAAAAAAAAASAPPAVVAAAQAMVAQGLASSVEEAIRVLQGGVGASFFTDVGMLGGGQTDDGEGGINSPMRGYTAGSFNTAYLQSRGLDPALIPSAQAYMQLEGRSLSFDDQINATTPQGQQLEQQIKSHPSFGAVVQAVQAEHARSRGGIGGFISNAAKFELSHLKNAGQKWGQDPERAFLGINTPLESKLWGGITGKDYTPTIDMYGGAPEDSYIKAQEEGIDTSAGGAMHALARTIASIYAGGAAGKLAQGAGLTATQAGAATGAAMGAGNTAIQGGSGEDILKSGAIGGLAGGAGGYAGDIGMLGRAGIGAGTGIARTALTGGDDYLGSALRGAAGGLAGGAMAKTPTEDWSAYDMSQNMPVDATWANNLRTDGGMLPQTDFTRTGGMSFAPGSQTEVFATPVPGMEFADPSVRYVPIEEFNAAQAAALGAQAATESDEAPAAAEPTAAPAPRSETDATVREYAKLAQKLDKVYQLLNPKSTSAPAFPPQGEQSDEEYQQSAVEYLGLDADAMAELGLKPGTPEYLEYILEQADAILAEVFGKDPYALLEGESVEDLQAALRDLNDKEAAQLARALYVRGALGQETSASEVVDPFTGISEELGMLPGEKVAGAEAGRQRGLARAVQNLAQLPGGRAREVIQGMLGRNVDIFNIRSNAEARNAQAMLEEALAEEERRRRRLAGLDEETGE